MNGPFQIVMGMLLVVFATFMTTTVIAPSLARAAAAERTPAEATAHALDELANAIAQGKVTLTPTPSPTATATPVPTSSPVPTETPTPVPTETPTPEVVCWLVDQEIGDPDSGFVVFDEEGHPVPCPVAQELVTEEPAPTPSPSAIAAPSAPPAPPVVQRVVEYVTLPTPEPQVIYVSRAEPTVRSAPTATRELVATLTPVPPRTPSPTMTALPTATPTATATAIVAGAARTDQAALGGRWDWLLFAEVLGAVLVLVTVGILFISRRRVAVWKGQSDAT